MIRFFAPSQKVFLLTAVTLLSGCADWEQHAQNSLPPPLAVYEDKQITVSPTRSTYAVGFVDGKAVLSADETAYLNDFLSRTVQDDTRVVLVEQPARRADRLERQRATALGQMLTHAGYKVLPLTGAERVPGKVQIAVDHLLAMAPDCPNWDVHRNFAFGANPLPNHGCADRSNLAAMVANPRDLVVGQVPSAPMGHAPLISEVNYRKGAVTPLQDAGDVVGAD